MPPVKQRPSPPASDSDEEFEKVGFINNLTQEELIALEEKKARAAAAVLAARERESVAKAKQAFEEKKNLWKKKKAYVKGSKICEQNRIYDDSKGWYVCEVCDKKFNDIEWIEEHVATAKHQRNLEWYSTNPLPSREKGEDEVEIPECVEWREDEEIYVCTLCDAKAASDAVLQAHLAGKEHAKRLANAEWYAQGSSAGQRGGADSSLPSYCETEEDWIVCRFCEKKMASMEMMEAHLTGKEHAKKCANIDIPAYGEPNHFEKAKAYVDSYGFEMWCRQHHWPELIVDEANCWACSKCLKRFITPSAVNAHLTEKHSGNPAAVVSETARRSPAPPPPRKAAPAVVSPWETASHWCEICHLPFVSVESLQKHETSDTAHLLVLKRLAEPLIDI